MCSRRRSSSFRWRSCGAPSTGCGSKPSRRCPMTAAQVIVTILGLAAVGWVLWYFLGSRGLASAARESRGVQEIAVTVKGGYQPDTILVQAGTPVRLRFYRDETADCSERVVFEHFGIDRRLPAFETTVVEFTPTDPGEYPFR